MARIEKSQNVSTRLYVLPPGGLDLDDKRSFCLLKLEVYIQFEASENDTKEEIVECLVDKLREIVRETVRL